MVHVTEIKRNLCLDLFKGIACIFVVFMHCEFPGYFGVLVQSISRFCVPLFFMISGYFCYYEGKKTDYAGKILHILKLLLGAAIFYIIVTPLYSVGKYSLSLIDVLKCLIFNVPPYIAPQLWFLLALLYDYILFGLIERLNISNFVCKFIPAGIAAYIILAQGLHMLGYSVPNLIYRNFLIEGLTMFTLGYWIHGHQEKVKISNSVLIFIIVISTILSPIERMLMGRDFGVNIVTFPQVIAMFIFAINNPTFGKGSAISSLGATYSVYIYIMHPAVMNILNKMHLSINLNNNTVALYAKPLICLLATFVLSFTYVKIKNCIKVYRSSKKA